MNSNSVKTPRERYNNDPLYNGLVNAFTSLLRRKDCSPSELRQAAILAATRRATINRHMLGCDLATQRYRSDEEYATLINGLIEHIDRANFTMGEIREAAVVACIVYEEMRCKELTVKEVPTDVEDALFVLHEWLDGQYEQGEVEHIKLEREMKW